jgi:hypothetical protein
MTPGNLILLAPVAPGREGDLDRILRAMGDDIRGRRLHEDPGRPHIHFPRSRRIHFARMALVPDPGNGSGPTRLLYASTFDGSMAEHLRELTEITSGMDELWGHCRDYIGAGDFPTFVRAHRVRPHAFYIAFRDGSVEAVHRDLALRGKVEAMVDGDPVGGGDEVERLLAAERRRRSTLPARFRAGVGRIVAGMRRIARAAPLLWDVPRAMLAFGPVTVWRASLTILATLDRYPAMRIFNRLVRNRLPPMGTDRSALDPDRCPAVRRLLDPEDGAGDGDEPPPGSLPPSFREDTVAQNQLTLLTGVEPGQVRRLRAVLAAVDALAKRLSPPGSLTGISTIHFVRWVVLDGDRRLLMLSDYDGSWENYIDEFAEMILSGLDAIWGGATGYPPDGARDLPAFKDFLRTHQVPTPVFYSAYPSTTTLNILSNRALARALGSQLDAPTGS